MSSSSEPTAAARLLGVAAAGLLLAAVVVGWVLPARFGGATLPIVVTGSSMEPTYEAGDIVFTRTNALDEVAVGDIAVVTVPTGQKVIHRVEALTPDGPVMRGDNAVRADPWGPQDMRLTSVAWFRVPNMGRWIQRSAADPLLLGAVCAMLGGLVAVFGSDRARRRHDVIGARQELAAAFAAPSALVVLAGLATAVLLGSSLVAASAASLTLDAQAGPYVGSATLTAADLLTGITLP